MALSEKIKKIIAVAGISSLAILGIDGLLHNHMASRRDDCCTMISEKHDCFLGGITGNYTSITDSLMFDSSRMLCVSRQIPFVKNEELIYDDFEGDGKIDLIIYQDNFNHCNNTFYRRDKDLKNKEKLFKNADKLLEMQYHRFFCDETDKIINEEIKKMQETETDLINSQIKS